MRRQAPSHCPVCGDALKIARLECDGCTTAIEGDFDNGRLGRLTREQLSFVEVFLECRGKIKEVEQRLGISYPTVVARLDEVVAAMEPAADGAQESRPKADRSKQAEVLEALERGEITAAEAASRLRSQRGGR